MFQLKMDQFHIFKILETAINKEFKFNKVHFIINNMHAYFNWFHNSKFFKVVSKLKLFDYYDIIKILSYFGQIKSLEYIYNPDCEIRDDIVNLICKDIMFMNLLNFENLPDKLSCVKFAVKNNWPISNKCCDFCSDTDIIRYILDQNYFNMIYYNTCFNSEIIA